MYASTRECGHAIFIHAYAYISYIYPRLPVLPHEEPGDHVDEERGAGLHGDEDRLVGVITR